MSAPSKTSRLGRGSYQRPSADVLDQLTDPGPTPPVDTSVAADNAGTAATSVTTDSLGTAGTSDDAGTAGSKGVSDVAGDGDVSDTIDNSVVRGTSETTDTWVTAVASDVPGDQEAAGVSVDSGVRDVRGTSDDPGDLGTADVADVHSRGTGVASGASGNRVVQETSDSPGSSGHLVTTGTLVVSDNPGDAGVTGNSEVVGNRGTTETRGVSGTQGTRQKRASKPSTPAVVEVVSGNRGTSDAPAPRPAATPRDHVKVARPLVDEMRDAVWFLSEHGRPRVQLGELLDEAISAWLKDVKAQHTRGAAFPIRGRLR